MDPKLAMYLGYLVLSLTLTAWVSRSLYRNGQVFSRRRARQRTARRIDHHLLVVGFWLLNAGFVAVMIQVDGLVTNATDAVETLSMKLGFVLIVLGGVHLFNVYVLNRFRRRRMLENEPPPVRPTAYLPQAPASPASTTKRG